MRRMFCFRFVLVICSYDTTTHEDHVSHLFIFFQKGAPLRVNILQYLFIIIIYL